MARRRSLSDVLKMLRRHLRDADTMKVQEVAVRLREYAAMRSFMHGNPLHNSDNYYRGGTWDAARVEQAVRNVMKRKTTI